MALKALIAAHAQSAWNRSTRQLTKAGRNFALAFIGLGWLMGATGFGGAMLGMGWAAGKSIDEHGFTFAGAVLFTLSWGLGLLFGTTGGGRLLEVGQLRAYPVRPFTLLFAELAARLAEPLTAGVVVGLFAFHFGLAISEPSLIPRLLVLFPLLVYVLVAAQFVLGELLAAVAKRARLALALLVIAGLGLSPRVLSWVELQRGSQLEQLERLASLIEYLPTTRLLAAPQGGLAAVLRLLEGLLGPALLTVAGVWVMSREQTAHAQVATEKEGGLWTFETPAAGIARLHLSTLFRTPIGRYSLIAPLFAMVMVPWVLQLTLGVQRAALGVFMYAALGTVQFHFNVFGFDGPSVNELFRLPVSARTLFFGKHVAVLSLALLEGAALALFLRLVRDEALAECVAGLCVFMSINLTMGTLGRFVSVLWPRTLPRSGMRGSAPPLPVVLVNLLGTFGIVGALGVTHWLVQRFLPSLLIPWGLLVLGASAALFGSTLGLASRFLEARREHVLLAMK